MCDLMTKIRRFVTSLLAAALIISASPSTAVFASDSWMQNALNKLVGWGIMAGDPNGDLRGDDPIIRAEFVAMANRAFGYDETGPTPFTDVPTSSWYANDISIAYNADIFSGTSPTTASPNARLTREQALVLIAHSLRMQAIPGEVTEFTDGRAFEDWSQGYVKAVMQSGLISGYPDGTFRPQNDITRGEVANILTTALGTLINEQGDHRLGGVYGNVTINTTNVTLRNTTIAGDLYITGGLGLGAVTLENVNVLGRIIIAGGGESEKGDPSVILRNVDAKELVIDTVTGQYISVSIDGDTDINSTTARTSSWIQDNTRSNRGLRNIYLDGKKGCHFTLAGNIKNVVNRTPGSTLNIAQGETDTLTIDEKAVGSKLIISMNTVVNTLNMDIGIKVEGSGGIGTLNVSGPNASTSMLPDKIVIRPGIVADIDGEKMDTVKAEESSSRPKILSSYPEARNVASTSLTIAFAGNKSGTIYWAVSPENNGPVSTEDLISPPSYGASILKSGSVKLTESKKEATVKVTGLSADGTYYISAVLVDSRDWRSPRRTASFDTPDDSVPAFATGYPYMSKITDLSGQVTAMTTKSCELYYALLTKGSKAPTPNEFRANAITGNLGFGVVRMKKNVADSFTINDQKLAELASYDLYLWLTDSDDAKSSAVKKVSFTTVDKTPPEFVTKLTVNSAKETSVGCYGNLNEAGSIYWAAVTEGTEYPKPPAGSTAGAIEWTDPYAKLQVSSGMNAFKSGKVSAKANTDFTFNITGLKGETAYDIYYVAVDAAGNYSNSIDKLTASTLDVNPPKVSQEFTRYSGTNAQAPYANTDIRIIFSENVQRASTNEILLKLYENVTAAQTADKPAARETLAEALRHTIKMYNAAVSGLPTPVSQRTSGSAVDAPWTIDYRYASLELREGKLILTLPTKTPSSESALNLNSGSTYFFQIEDIADTSTAKNLMGITELSRFTTISAQAALANDVNVSSLNTATATGVEVDMAFSMTPLSTSKVEKDMDWDMLLWLDTSAKFTLYQRERGQPQWAEVGSVGITIPGDYTGYVGSSVGYDMKNLGQSEFPPLTDLDENKVYEYAIHFDEIEGIADRTAFSQYITCKVSVVSGSTNELKNLGADVTQDKLDAMLSRNLIASIGTPDPFAVNKQFKDGAPPKFTDGYPRFSISDTTGEMALLLSRPGTVYYVIAPVGDITSKKDGRDVLFEDVPQSGADRNAPYELSAPSYLSIVKPEDYYSGNPNLLTGSLKVGTGMVSVSLKSLQPKKDYYAYFVVKGTGQVFSEVQLFRFTTSEITRPVITLSRDNSTVTVKSDLTSKVNYMLIPYNNNMSELLKGSFGDAAIQDAPLSPAQKKLTVLQAMATDVVVGNKSAGSLYDTWARKDHKDDLANYIRTSTPSGGNNIAGTGSTSVKGGASVSVDCSKMGMSQNVEYCFLAVGHSEQGSGDAFRATYPVTLVDQDAPKVIDVNSTLTANSKGIIKGDVTLVFDEYLYYREQGGSGQLAKLRPVDRGNALRPGDTSDYISIASLVSSKSNSISVVTSADQKGKRTLTIDLKFTNAVSGAFITFDSNLSDQNSSVAARPLNVSVSLNDAGQPVVNISPSWEGR